MNFKLLVLLGGVALLASCTSLLKQQTKVDEDKQTISKEQRSPIALERMGTQFLYLAAQQALGRNQPSLSVRFLKALIKQHPDEVIPRFELVDLLLASRKQRQVAEAKVYIESIPEGVKSGMHIEALIEYQTLYARTLMANKNVKKATSILSELLLKYPERLEVRILLARLHVIHKNYTKAHQIIRAGLKLKDNLRLKQLLVQLYLQQGHIKQADKTLMGMQQEFPNHESIVLQRAHLAEQQGQDIKSESLLQLYIELHPKTAVQSLSMLAAIYLRQNKLDEAIIAYQRMLPMTGSDSDVLLSLGQLLYQQQDYIKAAEYFQQTIESLIPQGKQQRLSNGLATAYFYYGASLEASGQAEPAIRQYNKLQPRHDLYLDAQLRLVNIAIRQEHFTDAEKKLLVLKSKFKHELSVFEVLSGLRLQQEKYQGVINETNQAVDLGYSQILLFNRAVAFEKLKQFKELDVLLERMLNHEPNDAETLNFYGYSLADRGVRLQDAEAMIRQALKIKPNDGYYLDSLAWVYFKKKQYVKALEIQLRAIEATPSDPVMVEHLGDMYWKQNRHEHAYQAWKKALNLGHAVPDEVKLKLKQGLM